MSLLLQQIIIGIFLIGAVGLLIFYFKRKKKRKANCQCCPAMQAVKNKPFQSN